MNELIEALSIFLKYANHSRPTHCEHDTLYIVGIEKGAVSAEDVERLDKLGFFWDEECFISFRYGSA